MTSVGIIAATHDCQVGPWNNTDSGQQQHSCRTIIATVVPWLNNV